MRSNKTPTTVKVQFEDIELIVKPDNSHEWLLETSLVAKSYQTTFDRIRKAMYSHNDELIENIHYVRGAMIEATPSSKNFQPNQIFWTKRGVVKLGFFLRSETAKKFRRFAEDLIIEGSKKSIKIDIFENEYYERILNEVSELRDKVEAQKYMTIGEFIEHHRLVCDNNGRYELGLKARIACDNIGLEARYQKYDYDKFTGIYPQYILINIFNPILISCGIEPIYYKINNELKISRLE